MEERKKDLPTHPSPPHMLVKGFFCSADKVIVAIVQWPCKAVLSHASCFLSHANCFLICSVWFSCWTTRLTSTRPARVGGMLSTLLAGDTMLHVISVVLHNVLAVLGMSIMDIFPVCRLQYKFLCQISVFVPPYGSMSLYWATSCMCVSPHRHGQLKCVRLLLERGARIVPDNEGVSPLELCAQVFAAVPWHTVWRRIPTLEWIQVVVDFTCPGARWHHEINSHQINSCKININLMVLFPWQTVLLTLFSHSHHLPSLPPLSSFLFPSLPSTLSLPSLPHLSLLPFLWNFPLPFFFPLSSLLSFQNSYHECAEAMLTSYPNEVYPLVQIVCSEKIPETKALSLLEYLCNTSTYLLAMILGRLASDASTAGMELLRWDIWGTKWEDRGRNRVSLKFVGSISQLRLTEVNIVTEVSICCGIIALKAWVVGIL